MKLPFPEFTYCIDTSAIIDIRRRQYPPDVFESLSLKLDDIIDGGQIIAPHEVLRELGSIDDEVLKWAKVHRHMFRDLDDVQVTIVKEVMANFPRLVDVRKTTPAADPYIVALAKIEGATVISSEGWGDMNRPRIPDVCRTYAIPHMSALEFFRHRGWKF